MTSAEYIGSSVIPAVFADWLVQKGTEYIDRNLVNSPWNRSLKH